MRRAFVGAAVALGLAACGAGAGNGAGFDPMSTDIEALRLAVRMPAGVGLQNQKVSMTVTAGAVEEVIPLQVGDPAPQDIALAGIMKPDERWLVLSVDKDGARRFEAMRSALSGLSKDERSIAVDTESACRLPGLQREALSVSVFAKTAESEEYISIVENYDLAGDLGDGDLMNLPACGG